MRDLIFASACLLFYKYSGTYYIHVSPMKGVKLEKWNFFAEVIKMEGIGTMLYSTHNSHCSIVLNIPP